MKRLKVLLCGEYSHTEYHPLVLAEQDIRSALQDICDLTVDEHFESYGADGFCQYDVCIFRMEFFMDKQGTWPYVTNDIVTYLARGGRILLVHVPEILRSDMISQIFGCRFRMHPPMGKVEFCIADPAHPIAEGVSDFVLTEERHQLIFDGNTPKHVFLNAKGPAGETPSGWTVDFGLGKAVYLMPGHDGTAYRNPQFQKLFCNAVRWLGGEGQRMAEKEKNKNDMFENP